MASGIGEPGLTLSTLLPEGKVTGSDLSDNMVAIANKHALERDITNYQSQQSEATFESPEIYWDIFSDVAGPIMEALNNEPQEVIYEMKQAVINKAADSLRNGQVYTNWQATIASGIKK